MTMTATATVTTPAPVKKHLPILPGRIHGVPLPGYRLAKVRYRQRQWIHVWATLLPDGKLYVAGCSTFPHGGSWKPTEAYFLPVETLASVTLLEQSA